MFGRSKRGRAGAKVSVTSSESSRYEQEYPPIDECKERDITFVASPIRRASSESTLAVLRREEVVDKLEHGTLSKTRAMKKSHEIGSQIWAAETPIPPSAAPCATDTTSQPEKCYLNLEFDACVQEHPNTNVAPKLLGCLGISYKYSKLVAYYIFVILVGIPMTFVWGCMNGSAVFCCVWMWGPTLKLITLCIHSCAPVFVIPVQVICSPIVDVFARILRQVRMQAIIIGQPALEKLSSQLPIRTA